MMVISMTAFAQEDVFSGDWLGANKEGDLKVAFTLNCDGNWQLNPYNENARCNGFMEVNMLEPGGRESLMATYEFYVESMNGNELTLSFVGGRPEVDAGISGQCKVVYRDDKLSFTGLDKGGKDAAFNGLTLVKSGSGADAIADAAADDGVPLGVKILAVLQLILYIAVVLFIVGHMFFVWYKGARYKEVFTVEGMLNKRLATSIITMKITPMMITQERCGCIISSTLIIHVCTFRESRAGSKERNLCTNTKWASITHRSLPALMALLSARLPRSSPMAPRMMLFPAPVSPVMTENPG